MYTEIVENLRIYKRSLELVGTIYKLTRDNSKLARDYSLVDQIRRASVSILANIAEGYKRSNKQFTNHLLIASGSANEVVAQLQIISLVYGIKTEELQNSFKILGKQINSFVSRLKSDK